MDESKYGFVAIANELLLRFQLPAITHLAECTSQMFVALYEGILGEKHPHIVSVRNKQDEVTNVQVVIDSLAQDVLHADLSHISGQAVVEGDHVTIRYLLEIFTGLMEYVMEQITSGASTDAEDELSAHDPDILTQGTISTISDILQEELGTRDHSYETRSRNKARSGQRLKQSDVSLPSTISNIESHYDSEYSSDSTIELPQHALVRNTGTVLPQDVLPVAGRRPEEQHYMLSGLNAQATGPSSTAAWTPSSAAGPSSRAAGPPLSAVGPPSRTAGPPLHAAGPPSRATGPHSSAAGSPSMATGPPSRATGSEIAEEDSEGEKIRQRVLENESIEKRKEMQKIGKKAEVQGDTSTDVDSTGDLIRGSADIERKFKSNGNLQVEEVTSSLASTSPPPSATKHHRTPSGMMMAEPGENVFASLGVRPKPASHPHFRKEHQEGRLDNGSGPGSKEDQRVRRHVHTHHHFHASDDWHNYPSKQTTTVGSRSSRASHTITRPVPDDGTDQYPTTSRFSSSLQHSKMDRPRDENSQYMVHDVSSRLGQSLPLPMHDTAVTTDRPPVGYSLRSHREDEPSASRTSKRIPQRKVAFAVDDQDEFPTDEVAGENELTNNEEDDLDKVFILQQLRERLIDRRANHRFADESSDHSDNDTDSDISLHSDSVVDYDHQPHAKRYRVYSPKRENRPKSSVLKPVLKKNHVHFDDALDEEAKGKFGKIRRSIRKEGASHQRKTKAMKKVYANHLQHLQTGQKELIDKKKKAAEQLDMKYRRIHQIPKMKRYSAARKYTTSSVADNHERRKIRGQVGKRKRSASSSPILIRNRRPLVIEDDEMLPTVMSEFPMLHVSPHTAHNMWSKQMRQLEQLTKSGFSQSRKTKTQMKMEEAEKRQELLLGIMRKELAHNRRMKDIKEKREHEKAMKTKIVEQRQATARARRYYDQFKVRASARMLKRKNREEQIFKKLFEDGLDIQKNRIRELRKYAKEKREEMAVQQQNEIESLENYYSNQFAMLAEAIGQERHDLLVRDNAQAKVMTQMKRELRRKMECEIQEFQENLYNDEDREYFRQVEADRMKRELQMAAYKTTL